MYYEEQIINGILHHRGMPNAEWIQFTLEQLTSKIEVLRDERRDLLSRDN